MFGLEFSFNRSNESTNLRNATDSDAPKRNQETPVQPPLQAEVASSDTTSTITNERLRKAIEKNRARQAERNRTQPQASFFDQQKEKVQETVQEEPEVADRRPPPRPQSFERDHTSSIKTSSVVTRRSVARPDEAEFTPVKRTTRKVASQISYTTGSRKKSKPLDPTLVGYLVKGCWLFCGVMILRLIFAHGGVTDFYSQRSLYSDRLAELDRIKKENMQLVHEIERMQTDTAFQKKLVRDNLGFIAADEFLVLFPKEKTIQ